MSSGQSQSSRPSPADAVVRRRMERQRRRDTDPEMRLRRALHALGYRYRIDAPLPGMPRRRADLLFTKHRVAVFVDGCFWHGCPAHRTHPKNNAEWWRQKIEGNIARDRATDEHLAERGWCSVRIWEHEDVDEAVGRVVARLQSSSS